MKLLSFEMWYFRDIQTVFSGHGHHGSRITIGFCRDQLYWHGQEPSKGAGPEPFLITVLLKWPITCQRV